MSVVDELEEFRRRLGGVWVEFGKPRVRVQPGPDFSAELEEFRRSLVPEKASGSPLGAFLEGLRSGVEGTARAAVSGLGELIGRPGLGGEAEDEKPGILEAWKSGEGLGEAAARDVGRAFGSTALLAGVGLPATVLGGPLVGAAAAGSVAVLASLGDMAEELRKRYGVEVPVWKILPAAIATGALDVSALGRIGHVVVRPTPGFIGWLKDVLQSAGVEAGTEALQEVLQRSAVVAEVPKETLVAPETAERAVVAGLLGGVVGGTFGGVSSSARRFFDGARFRSLDELRRAAEEEKREAQSGEKGAPSGEKPRLATSILEAFERSREALGERLGSDLGSVKGPYELVVVEDPSVLAKSDVARVQLSWRVPRAILEHPDPERIELFQVLGYERVLPSLRAIEEGKIVGPEAEVSAVREAAKSGDLDKLRELFERGSVTASEEAQKEISLGFDEPLFVAKPKLAFVAGLSPVSLGLSPYIFQGEENVRLQFRGVPSDVLKSSYPMTAIMLGKPEVISDAIREGVLDWEDVVQNFKPLDVEAEASLRKIKMQLDAGRVPYYSVLAGSFELPELKALNERMLRYVRWYRERPRRVVGTVEMFRPGYSEEIPFEELIRQRMVSMTLSKPPQPPENPNLIIEPKNFTKEQLEIVTEITKAVQEAFQLKYPIQIVAFRDKSADALGFWKFDFTNGVHSVSLNTSLLKKKEDLIDTLIHELVHALHGERVLEADDPLLARLGLLFVKQWAFVRAMGYFPGEFVKGISKKEPGIRDWYDFSEFVATHGALFGLEKISETVKKYVEDIETRSVKFARWRKLDEGLRRQISLALEDLIAHPGPFLANVVGHSFAAHNKFVEEHGFPSQARLAAEPFKDPEVSRDVVHWHRFMDLGWTLVQIAQKNPHVRSLQSYVSRIRQMQHDKVLRVLEADEILRDWRRLPEHLSEALSEALYRYGAGKLDMLESLPEPAGSIAQRVIDYLRRTLDDLEQILIERLKEELKDPTIEIKKLKQDFAALRERPYFPFMRFGKYSVHVKSNTDGKTLAFYLFESERERAAELPEIEREFEGFDVTIEVGKLPTVLKSFIGVSPYVLKRVVNRLNLTELQRKELDKILALQFPSESARNRFLRKKKIEGYSRDAMRTFAAYAMRMANYMALIKHIDGLRQDIDGVVKESRSAQEGSRVVDVTSARKLADWLMEHLDYVTNPQNELVGLRTFAFLYHLGFNPASAFVNLTQPAMVTYPWLAAHFGDGVAVRAMLYALRNLRKVFTGEVSLKEKEILDLLMRQGLLDQSLVHELAGVAANDFSNRYLGKRGQTFLSRFAEVASFLFHNAERINRRLVALAAIRASELAKPKSKDFYSTLLARYRGIVGDLDVAYIPGALAAVAALDETMFDYSSYNRPKFMRGKKSAIFIFMTFVQHMLWAARHMPGRGRMLLLLGAAAGLMGLPGAEDIDDLIEALSSLVGERVRPSEELRKLLKEVMDDPDLVLHGLGYGLGDLMALLSGMPGPDLSGHFSLGRVVPGLRGVVQITRGDVERGLGTAVEDISGAGFAVMWKLLNVAFNPHPEFLKNVEQVVPTALRNLMMAVRWLASGKEVDSTGAAIVRFDPADRASLFLTALGFKPAKYTKALETRRLTEEAVQFWQKRRQILLRSYFWAELPEERRRVVEEIRRFNAESPPGFRISLADLRRSYEERFGRARLKETYGAPQKSRIPFSLGRRALLEATE